MRTKKISKNNLGRQNKNGDVLRLGGKDGERLYLADLKFKLSGRMIEVLKTKEPDVDMKDLVARHKGRYGLFALFSRPGYRVLDFPCGSGYASAFLKEFGVIYYGMDMDIATIEYAKRMYGAKNIQFDVGDLCLPKLKSSSYDIIGCVEGLEHIDKEPQKKLISAFYKALKPDGILIVSSPENKSGVSGPSKLNPYHKWELTKNDFVLTLGEVFGAENIELVTHKAILSPGLVEMNCFYGICHRK